MNPEDLDRLRSYEQALIEQQELYRTILRGGDLDETSEDTTRGKLSEGANSLTLLYRTFPELKD